MFILDVLGKYGPYPKGNSATSSYLIKTDAAAFTLDFGAGAFSKLALRLQPKDLSFMILTHTHSDHTSDMGVMGYYLQRKNVKMTVYMPKPDREADALRFASYGNCEFVWIDETATIKKGGLKITFVKLRHPVTNYGVRVEYNGKVFVYTGDTNTCDNLFVLLKNADYALMDACFLHKDWGEQKPHLSAMLCARACEKSNVKLLMTHIDADYDENDLVKEAKAYHDDSLVVEEGKEYDLE